MGSRQRSGAREAFAPRSRPPRTVIWMDMGRTARAAWVLHDDPPTTALVRSLLTSDGFDVTAAESPLRLLADPSPRPPSLVLVGLTAVDERDLELVAVLRRRWPRARILVLFPSVLRERAARCLAFGADGYLPEPFYPAELSALAQRLVDPPAADHAGGSGDAPPAQPGPGAPPAPADARSDGSPTPAAPAASGRPDASAPAQPADERRADEAIGRLAAGIAHTVRNPLQALELQLGSYETDGTLDVDAAREQLRRIATAAESLVRFAGRRRLSTRVVDVNALVVRVFEPRASAPAATRRLAATRERLDVLGAPDLLRAAVDAVRDRADRVTPPGGRIDVATRLVEEGGVRWAEISVTDGGPPPGRRDLSILFDPFPEGDDVGDGSGLEMAAAAGIVRNHGGTVAARAAGAAGTTIVLRLPLRGRGADAAGREEGP